MALYTLKSRDEALLPLANYNGDNTWVRNQLSSLGYAPTPAQTQVYSALGRTTGAEGNGGSNFFERRGRSIENALGTTGSSIVSAVNDRIENDKTIQMLKDNKTRMNDIAKKYGFNSWSDWQDANAAARESGDTEAIKRFDTQLKEFQAQANANAAKANEKAANYEDYRKNDYISNKINQDRGKFAGSAINTLSTAVDVTGLGVTPVSNAIQGGIEGVADELEQNGLENFDWGRAGQNAAIGATTGAVTGALNKGISNSLAKNGGNLFKGGNALTRGLNNLGSKTAVGRGVSTIASGAARGAVSGAVGGATGAGLQSAMNGVEFGQGVQNALQGAVQGAQQGAVTGGIMAGANAAFGKTNFGKQLQNAKTNWDQSGSNFDERLTNTLTSGDSAVGDWLMNKRQSNILGAVGNLGNRVQDVKASGYKPLDENDLRTRELTSNWSNGNYKNIDEFYRLHGDINDFDNMTFRNNTTGEVITGEDLRNSGVLDKLYSNADFRNFGMGTNNGLGGASSQEEFNLYINNDSADNLANVVKEWTDWQPTRDWNDSRMVGSTPTTAKGWAKKAGQRIVEDVNNSNLGNRVKDVSSDMPEDIRNMQIRDYNANADGQDNSRPYEYIGANGKKALKIELPILNDVPAEESSAFIKQAVKDLAQEGRLLDVGDVPELANISSNSAKKAGDHVGWNDTQLRQRNEVIADIDEVGGYLHNVRYEAPKAGSRDNVAGVVKGDVEVDINGEKIYPEVVYRLYDNGDLVLHDVTKINRLPSGGSSDHNLGRYVKTSEATRQPRDTSIVTQNNRNVNTIDPWDRVAQEAGYSNYDEVLQRYAEANPNAEINPRGMAGQVLTWMDQNPNTPTTAAGWAKRAGQRAVEDINNSNLGLKVQDVSQDDPSKQLYNALAGNRQPVAETEVETETTVVPSKTSAENKWRYAKGKDLLTQYGTVDAPMARATKAVETFQKLSDMGFEKPADVESISNAITGANGYASTLNKNIIKSAKPVDTFTGDNGQTIDDFVDNSIEHNMLSGTNQGVAVKRSINAYLKSLPSRAEGSVDYTDSASDTFKVVQGLEARAAELEGRGGSTYHRATTEDLHQAAVLKDVASLLKGRIYDGADAKVAITPKVVSDMKALAPGNEKWAATVDDFAKNVKTPQDIRSFQEPFVKAGRYIDNQYVQAATVGGRMAANAGELPDTLRTTKAGIINDIANRVWNSSMAHRGRAALYGKLADRAAEKAAKKAANNPTTAKGWTKQAGQRAAEDLGNTNLGNRIQDVNGQPANPQVATPAELANTVADYNPSTQLYNAIGRTEGAIAQETPAQYLANAAQEAEIVSPMEAPTAPTNDIATSMGNTSTATYNALTGTPTTAQQATTGSINTGYYQPTGDYWTDIIASAMSAAIDANDVNAFTTLYGMYQDQMANVSKASSKEKDYSNPTNWSSADRTKLLSAQNAMGQIDQLEEAYNQATGGEGSNAIQGWLRSRASDISGGNWDPSAANYNSLSESVGMGIVKNLINLGVTEADAQRYLKYLPALTDTKEQAAQKLDTLRGIYQNQINNLYGAYGL